MKLHTIFFKFKAIGCLNDFSLCNMLTVLNQIFMEHNLQVYLEMKMITAIYMAMI